MTLLFVYFSSKGENCPEKEPMLEPTNEHENSFQVNTKLLIILRVLFLLISTSVLHALLIREVKTFRLIILKQISLVGMDKRTTPESVVCNENPQSEEGNV